MLPIIHHKCVHCTMELLLHRAVKSLRQEVHQVLQVDQTIECCHGLSTNLSAEHHIVFFTAGRGLR